MILALDLATATGVAHESGLLTTWALDQFATKHVGGRFAALRRMLYRLHDEQPFTRVVCEHAAFGAPHRAVLEFHGRMLGVVLCWTAERSIALELVKPTEIKKFATGSGAAKKSQMVAAAKTLLGRDCEDDNQADALWLLEFAKAKRDGKVVASVGTPAKRRTKQKRGPDQLPLNW